MIALILAGSVLLAGCMAQTGPGPAGTTGPTTASPVTGTTSLSPQLGELVAFVEEAAAHARTNGRASSIASFNDPNGSWTRKELYIFAYDMNGTVLALPFQPESVGTNRYGIVDANGVHFVQDAIAAARNGSGFFRYHYPNPARGYAVEEKTSYVIGLGDWFVGAGVYTPVGRVRRTSRRGAARAWWRTSRRPPRSRGRTAGTGPSRPSTTRTARSCRTTSTSSPTI
ncbi:MAG TPA: cache domain-containing protein [Methanoregulaceae archaeon]|nr:cache domain-containing protein [Methanoregulaceae archaeon]